MKTFNHWLLAIFLLLPFGLGAQTFTQTNGTVNACSGNFYDSGNVGGTYLNGGSHFQRLIWKADGITSISTTVPRRLLR